MKPVRTLQLLLIVVAGAMTANVAQAADSIKVNGVTIPQSRFDLIVKNATAQGQADTPNCATRSRIP